MPHLCDKSQRHIFLFYNDFLSAQIYGRSKSCFAMRQCFAIERLDRIFNFYFAVVSSPMANAQITMKRRMHRIFFRQHNAKIGVARALPGFALAPRFEKTDVVQYLN